MKRYLKLTNQLISYFDDVRLEQVPQEENSEVDEVAKLASSNDTTEKAWTIHGSTNGLNHRRATCLLGSTHKYLDGSNSVLNQRWSASIR